MNETWLGTIPLIQTIILAVGAWFYMLGGREGKWKRRFIGSLLSATALWLGLLLTKTWNIYSLLVYPILIIEYHLGYSADTTIKKVIRRTITSLTNISASILMYFIIGGKAWLVLPISVLLNIASIWLAVKNPIYAAPEEYFVCLLRNLSLLMYPFVGK